MQIDKEAWQINQVMTMGKRKLHEESEDVQYEPVSSVDSGGHIIMEDMAIHEQLQYEEMIDVVIDLEEIEVEEEESDSHCGLKPMLDDDSCDEWRHLYIEYF